MSSESSAVVTALEKAGHEVADVTQNRTLTRITIFDESAEADDLSAIVTDALTDEPLALNVTTEAVDSDDTLGTVISIRQR